VVSHSNSQVCVGARTHTAPVTGWRKSSLHSITPAELRKTGKALSPDRKAPPAEGGRQPCIADVNQRRSTGAPMWESRTMVPIAALLRVVTEILESEAAVAGGHLAQN
jgi:hypothetical protein